MKHLQNATQTGNIDDFSPVHLISKKQDTTSCCAELDSASQSGRSMVEILGVLSIIGVLSVGGIYGYKYAMKKHLQNELKTELVARAISVSSQMLAGRSPSIDSFSPNVKGYTMVLSAAPSNWNSASALEGGNYYDENGNVLSFADSAVESGDKAFSIGVGNLSEDLVEWFSRLSQETGLVHSVVDKSGQDISKVISDDGGLEQLAVNDISVEGRGQYEVYAVFSSDLAMQDTQEINEIVESTDLCSGHGRWATVDNSSGCTCERGYSGEKCEKEQDVCHGKGYWYANWNLSKCICDEGYEGVFCGDMVAYSPCQTLNQEGDKEQRGFKPSGTACEQAGLVGKCDDLGHCVPTNGKKCSSIDGCGEGEFCHFGGTYGGGSGQKGLTPNVCEGVNAESFEYQGNTYYYNTDKDLRSWCRGADKQANCTWGFLSYKGAQSWCKSLGAELVDADFMKANCEEFKKHLPQVAQGQQYWVANQSVVHLNQDCTIQKMSRSDGYAWAGAVVCKAKTLTKADSENNKCTDNSSCAKGYYCRIESHLEHGKYVMDESFCTPVGDSVPMSEEQKQSLVNAGFSDTVEKSLDSTMTYWAAKNWCLAKDKDLIDISGTRLQCYHNGAEPLVDLQGAIKGGTGDLYCCKKGQKCEYPSTKTISEPFKALYDWLNDGKTGWKEVWVRPVGTDMLGVRANRAVIFNSNEHGRFAALCEANALTKTDPGADGYSPCQTLNQEGDKEQRGFKPSGTACEQAGLVGKCDDLGHCVPTNGKKCSSIDGCGEGEFCHFGGTYGGGSGQKGLTPNVCEGVNAESFEYQGNTYYYNTDKDLRSWCRGADKQANCTWGFLSYKGAQSWCKSLGAELVDADFMKANCEEFKKHLPQVAQGQQYWVANQSVVHLNQDCTIQKMSRSDGYAWAGAVVCKKAGADTCSQEEGYKCDENGIIYMCGMESKWVKDTSGNMTCCKKGDSWTVHDLTLGECGGGTPGGSGGGGSSARWLEINGCECDKNGISTDASDDLCNIQCCRNKYGNNGYAVNQVCCRTDDYDCICKANGCKTGGSTTPLDDFCCAKAQGLV